MQTFNPLPSVISILSYRNSSKALEVSRLTSPAKLTVTPVVAFPGPSDEMVGCQYIDTTVQSSFGRLKTFVGIEIANEGFSTQRILEAGFVDSNGKRFAVHDLYWIDSPANKAIDSDCSCRGFPIQLKQGEYGVVYMMVSPTPNAFDFHEKAFVEIDSGELVFGVSQAVTGFADQISAALRSK